MNYVEAANLLMRVLPAGVHARIHVTTLVSLGGQNCCASQNNTGYEVVIQWPGFKVLRESADVCEAAVLAYGDYRGAACPNPSQKGPDHDSGGIDLKA